MDGIGKGTDLSVSEDMMGLQCAVTPDSSSSVDDNAVVDNRG